MWRTWQEINHKLPNAAVTCVTSAAGPRDGWRCRLQETHLLHNNPSQPIQPHHNTSIAAKTPRQRVSHTASRSSIFPFFPPVSPEGLLRHRPGLKARWSRGYGLFATVAGTKTEARGLFSLDIVKLHRWDYEEERARCWMEETQLV